MTRCNYDNRLTAFLLGDLPAPEAAAVRQHAAQCAACQAALRDLEPILAALRTGLAADAGTNPRLDIGHRHKALGTRPQSRYRVIRWAAKRRPWLLAAACFMVVLGILSSIVAVNFGGSGECARISAARSRESMLRVDEQMKEATGSLAPASASAPASDDTRAAAERIQADLAQPNPEPIGGSGLQPEVAADKLGSLFDRGFEVSSGVKSRLVTKGLYAGRTTGGRSSALGHYGRRDVEESKQAEAESAPSAAPAPTPAPEKPVASAGTGSGKETYAWGYRAGNAAGANQPAGGQLSRHRMETEGIGFGAGGESLPAGVEVAAASKNRELTSPTHFSHAEAKKDAARDTPVAQGAAQQMPQAPQQLFADSDGDGSTEGERRQAARCDVVDAWREAAHQPAAGHRPDRSVPRQFDEIEKRLDLAQPVPQPQESDGLRDRLASSSTIAPLQQAAQAQEAVADMANEAAEKPVGDVQLQAAETGRANRPFDPAPARPPRAKAQSFNPFVAVAENRFSTFGIDVDTASYTLTRQAIQAGQLPDSEVVRTEEIVNSFDYNDTAPDKTMFRIYLEGAPSPFGAPGLSLLRIGVKGKRLGREEQRPAVLTFLIDTSGSMAQPDRIGRARLALSLLLDHLSPSDRIQLVSFDNQSHIVLPPTPASDKAKVLAAFDRLQCNGSTNLEDGMRQAYQQAAHAFVPHAENRIILISDGVANLGSDSARDILKQVESYRRQGITFSVFGVGRGTYDDAMLQDLANKGDGVYRFLDSEDEVRRVFVDDLAATLNTIATDVKIQVEWSAEAVKRYRQLGYESRKLTAEQFRDDTVRAGEVGSGQSVTALYELDLVPAGKRLVLGTVHVRYRRADTLAIEEIEQPVTPEILAASIRATRPQFRLAAGAAAFAELLRGSPYVAGRTYADVAQLLRPVALELSLDGRVKELLGLAEAAETMSRQEKW